MVSELNRGLLLHLLTGAATRIDRARMSTAVTVVLLGTDDLAVLSSALRGLAERRYAIDDKLVLALYTRCPPRLKVPLACAPVVRRLPPGAFRRIFPDAYRRARTVRARQEMALTLESFLQVHPWHARDYEAEILGFLRSHREELNLRGLVMAGYLPRLSQADLALMKRGLRGSAAQRMNSLNGFCLLLQRHRELDPAVLAACTSAEMRTLGVRLSRGDPDELVRGNARQFLRALAKLTRNPVPGRAKRGTADGQA